MRAVIYARISKDEQSKYSIDEQIFLCKKFMTDEGHEIVDIYIDNGYSSKTMKRPDLLRMLSDIKLKKFDIICVWITDRLTRTTLDGLTMVTTMFRPNGIEFASVTEDIDTSTPDGMMMFTIRLSMAQREREKIAERSSMGQQGRIKKGLRNTSARPYGYNVRDDLGLEINEEEAPWLKQIFEWYRNGWGRAKIARTLNEKGVPTNRGLPAWKEKIIGDIIRNITYTGCVHYKPKGAPENKRIIVPNIHEPLISKETFDEVQNIAFRRREHDMNLSSYNFPFSTIVKCAVCGRSYHGKLKTFSDPKREQYRYYRCSGKYRPDTPCNESDIIENKIVSMLFSHIDRVVSQGIDENRPITTGQIDITKERKRIEKQLSDSKERRKKWAKAMGEGKMEYEVYSELIDEENRKNESLQQQLSELPDETPTGKKSGDILRSITNIKSNWWTMTPEQQKRVIQSNFRQIIIGKVEGTWRILGVKFN